jgi:NitT/TauT family transport system permease protein
MWQTLLMLMFDERCLTSSAPLSHAPWFDGADVMSAISKPQPKSNTPKAPQAAADHTFGRFSGWIRFAPVLGLAVLLAVWQLLSLRYPPFILPGPALVAERFVEKLLDGTLIGHALTTLSEAIPGLLLGTGAAFVLGFPVAKSRLADRLLSPFIVATQGIPFIAVAPLLFIWFGNGLAAKILVCALIVFFPITINVIAGMRSVPQTLRDLFRALNASTVETFTKLELPAALPYIFAGLRVGSTLSMVGAITGEFLSSDQGLGFMINLGNGLYDTSLVIVGVIAIVLIALSLYGCVRIIEQRVIRS